MHTQSLPAATKNLIETGRKTVVGTLDAGRGGSRRAVQMYDQAFHAGADVLVRVPGISTSLRDDLVSLEGQLTLIARILGKTSPTAPNAPPTGWPGTRPARPMASSRCSTCA